MTDLVLNIKRIHFSFTINVSPKKYIMRKQWSTYSQEKQKEIFGHYIDLCKEKLEDVNYVFEKCKLREQLHVHGSFWARDAQDAKDFQHAIHNLFGMPKLEPYVCCYIEPTYFSRDPWIDYTLKDQLELLEDDFRAYKCLFRNEELHTMNEEDF